MKDKELRKALESDGVIITENYNYGGYVESKVRQDLDILLRNQQKIGKLLESLINFLKLDVEYVYEIPSKPGYIKISKRRTKNVRNR